MPQHSTSNQFSSSNPRSQASINVKKKIGWGNTVSINFLRSSVLSNDIAWSFITIKSTLYWRTKGICLVLNATQLKCGLWSNWDHIVEIRWLLFLHCIIPSSLHQYLYRTTPGSLHQYLYRTTPGSLHQYLYRTTPGSLQQYLYRTTPGSLHQYLYRTTPGSLHHSPVSLPH